MQAIRGMVQNIDVGGSPQGGRGVNARSFPVEPARAAKCTYSLIVEGGAITQVGSTAEQMLEVNGELGIGGKAC
jgi:hypothetical protein